MEIDVDELESTAISLLKETATYLNDSMNYAISLVSYIPEDFKYINTLSDYSNQISERLKAVNETVNWLNRVIKSYREAGKLSLQEINKLGETTLGGKTFRMSLAGKDESGNLASKKAITGERIYEDTIVGTDDQFFLSQAIMYLNNIDDENVEEYTTAAGDLIDDPKKFAARSWATAKTKGMSLTYGVMNVEEKILDGGYLVGYGAGWVWDTGVSIFTDQDYDEYLRIREEKSQKAAAWLSNDMVATAKEAYYDEKNDELSYVKATSAKASTYETVGEVATAYYMGNLINRGMTKVSGSEKVGANAEKFVDKVSDFGDSGQSYYDISQSSSGQKGGYDLLSKNVWENSKANYGTESSVAYSLAILAVNDKIELKSGNKVINKGAKLSNTYLKDGAKEVINTAVEANIEDVSFSDKIEEKGGVVAFSEKEGIKIATSETIDIGRVATSSNKTLDKAYKNVTKVVQKDMKHKENERVLNEELNKVILENEIEKVYEDDLTNSNAVVSENISDVTIENRKITGFKDNFSNNSFISESMRKNMLAYMIDVSEI